MYSRLGHVPFHLMRKLVQEHTAYWQHVLPQLTKVQYSVLSAIAEQPGIEQIELMNASVTTKATLAEMLARMERRGVIYRQQSELDKRRRFVYLTEQGQQLLKASTPLVNEVDEVFLSRLNAREKDEFIRLLSVLLEPKEPPSNGAC